MLRQSEYQICKKDFDMRDFKLGKYEYYKYGHQYHVIAVALDTIHKDGETTGSDGRTIHMETVIYRGLYPNPDLEAQFGAYPYFTRTMRSFTSLVKDQDGLMVPLFRYIGPMT